MVIILMGVAGAGKTTIGKLLAIDPDWQFFDGDKYHSSTAINRMTRGVALTDSDRKPGLDRLQKKINRLNRRGGNAVIACSALKKSYRDHLRKDNAEIRFIHLKGDYDMILKRLNKRKDHFLKTNLLADQFSVLEEPEDALTVDAAQEPEEIVHFIKSQLLPQDNG